MYIVYWEWLFFIDGMGSVIFGGDWGVVFVCLVDGMYLVLLLGLRFCLLNLLELDVVLDICLIMFLILK